MGAGAAFLFIGIDAVTTFVHNEAVLVVTWLLAPVLASFIAAGSGPRPMTQSVLGCMLGASLLLAIDAFTHEPPETTRDLLPSVCFLTYCLIVAMVAGKISPARHRAAHQPPPTGYRETHE
jgi:hypothetical protein